MSRTTVLIVEDEILIAWNLKRLVEKHGGLVVDIAVTAREAVDLAKSKSPGLILMDVALKGTSSGIDAAREIRTFSGVPLVFLTGNRHVVNESVLLETAAKGVYDKPPTEPEIIEMLALGLPGGPAD